CARYRTQGDFYIFRSSQAPDHPIVLLVSSNGNIADAANKCDRRLAAGLRLFDALLATECQHNIKALLAVENSHLALARVIKASRDHRQDSAHRVEHVLQMLLGQRHPALGRRWGRLELRLGDTSLIEAHSDVAGT